MPGFELRVRDGVVLWLAEVRLAETYHRMVERNQQRLARWEHWAESPQSLEGTTAWLRSGMVAFAGGLQVPTVLVEDGRLVGSCGARIDPYVQTATIGFWVDSASAGRGLVTDAARALVAHLVDDRSVERVELRTAVDNERSRSVATRLGFTLDGILRGAGVRRGERVDDCVYTLLAQDIR